MSNVNLEQVAATQKANAEIMTALMRKAFEGMQRLAELNMAATRDFFDATVSNANTLMGAKDANEIAKLNQTLAKPNLDKMMGYSRNVYELVSNMQKEVTSVMESQYSLLSKTAVSAIDKTKTAAPGGDVFAAAMKSMLEASNKAYENMTQMAKQMSEVTESNMQAAVSATTKAAKVAAKK